MKRRGPWLLRLLRALGVEGVRPGAGVRSAARGGCEGAGLASLHCRLTALHAAGDFDSAVAAVVAARQVALAVDRAGQLCLRALDEREPLVERAVRVRTRLPERDARNGE